MRPTRFALLWLFAIVTAGLIGTAGITHAAPPGQVDVLIGFKDQPGAKERAIVRGQGGTIKHSYTLIPSIAASVPQQAVLALVNNPNVVIIEPDVEVQAITYDDELALAWGVNQIESYYAHLRPEIDALPAITGAGVKVAVIDSGIDKNHPDLAANYVTGYDFVNVDNDPDDDNGHGTHCAGTIAAAANEEGVVGVAPGASLYSLKVLGASGSGSFSDVIAALQWAVDNGIDVTSNSYGSKTDPGAQVAAAFANAAQAGVLNIAAAGNDGNVKGKGNNVGYPASYDSVVAVGATDQSNNRAYFSSTGPAVEVAAPGYQIVSTYPGGLYATASGTSMACPHAAGMAALLIEAGLKKGVETNNATVRMALDGSCIDLGATGRDNLYGYGLINVASGIVLLETGTLVPADPPPEPVAGDPQTMTVFSIDYNTSGGPSGNKDLLITLKVQNVDTSVGVPTANVSITLQFNGSNYAAGSGNTDDAGYVTFRLRNAASGTWNTVVTGVTKSGYDWDAGYPDNVFVK